MGPFLAELCALAGLEMALPMNTGAEAVETAIKLARKWGYRVEGRGARPAPRSSSAATTFTAARRRSSASRRRRSIARTSARSRRASRSSTSATSTRCARRITPNTVAFLVEPIQAEAGIIMPPPGYLAAARALCREHNVLFVLDEIQTGLGRTGKMFAYEHEAGRGPDVLVLGKALGGGVYPVSAVLASRAIMTLLQARRPRQHVRRQPARGGRRPRRAARARRRAARRARGRARRVLARQAARTARAVRRRDSRPRACSSASRSRRPRAPRARTASGSRERGVLAKDTHEQVIRLAPPLIVERAELDWLVEQLRAVLALSASPARATLGVGDAPPFDHERPERVGHGDHRGDRESRIAIERLPLGACALASGQEQHHVEILQFARHVARVAEGRQHVIDAEDAAAFLQPRA